MVCRRGLLARVSLRTWMMRVGVVAMPNLLRECVLGADAMGAERHRHRSDALDGQPQDHYNQGHTAHELHDRSIYEAVGGRSQATSWTQTRSLLRQFGR